jgi:diguanylate cyclase (GGDEF)-like protein
LNRRDVIARIGTALAGVAAAGVAGPAGAAPDTLLTAEEQAWVAKHPVLLFAPERDFPPFSFVDSQGQHRGLSADVLDLVQEHTGLKFQAVAAGDRSNNLDRLKRREVDLLTSLRPTAEREQFIAFTSAYVSSPAVVLRRRADHRAGDLSDMGGQRLAVDRHSATEDFIRRSYPEVVAVEVDVAAQGLRDLATGVVDACAVNLATASYVIERDRLGGLRVAGETGYFSTLTLGYRKDWPMLGRVLEKGLAQISEAERATMIARWIPLSDIAWWQRPEVQRVLGAAAIGTGVLMAERQRLETRLRTLAEHDPLTGLMNRAALTEALRRSLALATRQKWSVAVVFIDLDKFKEVNDSLGHAAGDELLRQIASRLQGCLRESDLLGRLGGDEFIVVAEALLDGPRNAIELADKLLMQMKRPFLVDGRPLSMGFSAGIAIYPGDGDTPEALVANADAAMYQAKEQGRFRAALFQGAGPGPAITETST